VSSRANSGSTGSSLRESILLTRSKSMTDGPINFLVKFRELTVGPRGCLYIFKKLLHKLGCFQKMILKSRLVQINKSINRVNPRVLPIVVQRIYGAAFASAFVILSRARCSMSSY